MHAAFRVMCICSLQGDVSVEAAAKPGRPGTSESVPAASCVRVVDDWIGNTVRAQLLIIYVATS